MNPVQSSVRKKYPRIIYSTVVSLLTSSPSFQLLVLVSDKVVKVSMKFEQTGPKPLTGLPVASVARGLQQILWVLASQVPVMMFAI